MTIRNWAAVLFALLLAAGLYWCSDIGKNPPQTPSDTTVTTSTGTRSTFGANPPQTP